MDFTNRNFAYVQSWRSFNQLAHFRQTVRIGQFCKYWENSVQIGLKYGKSAFSGLPLMGRWGKQTPSNPLFQLLQSKLSFRNVCQLDLFPLCINIQARFNSVRLDFKSYKCSLSYSHQFFSWTMLEYAYIW